MIFKGSIVSCLLSSVLTMGTCYTANVDMISNEDSYVDVRGMLLEKYGFDPADNYLGIDASEEKLSIVRASQYTTTFVYTPNSTAVTVYKYLSDLDSSTISSINTDLDSLFPNADRLSSATRYYNCHSYAWYCADSSNQYWMDNPSAYYTDGSYSVVSSSSFEVTGDVGDILCYYNSNGDNLHSAIIVSKSSNSLSDVTVISKWGKGGLYRHQADYCPYMSTYGGLTSYVKSYKHAKHTYGSYTKTYNEQYHKSYCNCGSYKLVVHSVASGAASGQYATCSECGALLDLSKYSYPVTGKSNSIV